MTITRPRRWGSAIAAVAVTAALALAPVATATAAPLDAACGYAETGGAYTNSICWFDWSDYDSTTARTTDGQPVTVQIGEYTATFTVRERDAPGWSTRSVAATSTGYTINTPDYYGGIDGAPILYANAGSAFGAVTIDISDFEITLAGTPVMGYSLVAATAEWVDGFTGVFGEQHYWQSDVPLTMIDYAYLTPGGGCGLPLPGNGTTAVNCVGVSSGEGANGVILAAPSATRISGSAYMNRPGEREGVAFGIQTARVSVEKIVDGRVDADDSFDVSIEAPEGATLGDASTGTTDSADTGSVVLIPTGAVTLSESATAGAPSALSYYDTSWSCENATEGSTTVLPSGASTTQTVTPVAGDDISCTVTNTALEPELTLTKTADVESAGLGDTVTYSFTVTNTGALPVESLAIVEDDFTGSGALSTVTCPVTTLAPTASTTCSATYTVTQDDVDAGGLSNTATADAVVTGTSTGVESEPSTETVDTSGEGILSVAKTASASTGHPGDSITFTLTATNAGTTTLTDVELSDEDFTGAGELGALECDADAPVTLAPGESLTCEVDYTLLAADVGAVTNSAVGTARDPEDVLLSDDSAAEVDVTTAPSVVPGLAFTGSELGAAGMLASGLLVLGGLALALVGRTRRTRS